MISRHYGELYGSVDYSSDITVQLVDKYGGDWLICDAARVSTNGSDGAGPRELTDRDRGLLNTLVKQRHGAPFQHGGLTLFVEAPIFVFREWRTHRVYMHQATDDMSYSEQSARYRGGNPKFWIPRSDRALIKGYGWKPMTPNYEVPAVDQHEDIVEAMIQAYGSSWCEYKNLTDALNVAPEVARALLGVGMYSSMFVSTNPRSLSHFLSLRTHDDGAAFVSYPQAEIEEAARYAEEIFAEYWPETYKCWNDWGRYSL